MFCLASSAQASWLICTSSPKGLKITGMSRDVSWGFYIGQFTYFVGVAASGVMVVLPYYLHDYKAFGRITILGEFLAVASIIMCVLFVMVDLGNLPRMLNVILYPNPTSILFWDMIVLNVYLLLNIIIGWNVLSAERKGMPLPQMGQAPDLHLHSLGLQHPHGHGVPVRRSSGQALLAHRHHGGPVSLLGLLLRPGHPHSPLPHRQEVTRFDPGKEQIRTLASIVTYAMILNVFFFLLELFTAFYSQIPGHMHPIVYLFSGPRGPREDWFPGCGRPRSSLFSRWCS